MPNASSDSRQRRCARAATRASWRRSTGRARAPSAPGSGRRAARGSARPCAGPARRSPARPACPCARSQRTVVSRWFVIPIARSSAGRTPRRGDRVLGGAEHGCPDLLRVVLDPARAAGSAAEARDSRGRAARARRRRRDTSCPSCPGRSRGSRRDDCRSLSVDARRTHLPLPAMRRCSSCCAPAVARLQPARRWRPRSLAGRPGPHDPLRRPRRGRRRRVVRGSAARCAARDEISTVTIDIVSWDELRSTCGRDASRLLLPQQDGRAGRAERRERAHGRARVRPSPRPLDAGRRRRASRTARPTGGAPAAWPSSCACAASRPATSSAGTAASPRSSPRTTRSSPSADSEYGIPWLEAPDETVLAAMKADLGLGPAPVTASRRR